MTAFDQLWFYLLVTLVAGVGLGAFLARFLSDRLAQVREVRWKRLFTETHSEHELSIGKLTRTLNQALEKQQNLRQALDESDETVRLLTANHAPVFAQDVHDRNLRIAELEKKISRARAKAADATDQEATLQRQIDSLQTTLADRERQLSELAERPRNYEREKAVGSEQKTRHVDAAVNPSIKHGGARVISIHKHRKTDDLAGNRQALQEHDDTELRVRTLERELQKWKSKYEATRENSDGIASDLAGVESKRPAHAAGTAQSKDDLKLIRGIGPALETALNELGFYQFAQLANMDQPDIEQMGHHDSSLPGRLRRYRWIEQARKLQQAQRHDWHA